jgi:hypothetical protein
VTGATPPTEPVVVFKAATAWAGPNDDLVIPKGSAKTDWVVELAVVIGKRASYVAEDQALDFAPVLAAVARFRAAAEGLDAALDAAGPLPLDRRSRINDAVVAVERRLLDPAGLPGRPWFRHVLYAPGLTTGYAPWPFPGLAQAVKDHDAAMWQAQAATVVERLDAATAALGEAAALAR